ncbi:hypothetical protein GEMRC1_000417 [Eukaryota sp. GEM-RC1]
MLHDTILLNVLRYIQKQHLSQVSLRFYTLYFESLHHTSQQIILHQNPDLDVYPSLSFLPQYRPLFHLVVDITIGEGYHPDLSLFPSLKSLNVYDSSSLYQLLPTLPPSVTNLSIMDDFDEDVSSYRLPNITTFSLCFGCLQILNLFAFSNLSSLSLYDVTLAGDADNIDSDLVFPSVRTLSMDKCRFPHFVLYYFINISKLLLGPRTDFYQIQCFSSLKEVSVQSVVDCNYLYSLRKLTLDFDFNNPILVDNFSCNNLTFLKVSGLVKFNTENLISVKHLKIVLNHQSNSFFSLTEFLCGATLPLLSCVDISLNVECTSQLSVDLEEFQSVKTVIVNSNSKCTLECTFKNCQNVKYLILKGANELADSEVLRQLFPNLEYRKVLTLDT